MVYLCKLGEGQTVYLEEQNDSTIVTTVRVDLGQQQQSKSSFATGEWIASPEMYHTPHGIILKLNTAQGQHYIEIQKNDCTLLSEHPNDSNYRQIPIEQVASIPSPSTQTMQPMKSMQPMRMGNMQMSKNPMEMRMGNMVLQMKIPDKTTTKQRFCSRCGTKVALEDRFCSSCGHALR
jgi:ribosomal protein S27AE